MTNDDLSGCSVIGLGKLGACIAACVAARGYPVIGVDVLPETIAAVNEGKAPVFETGLASLIEEHRERLRATTDVGAAVLASSITFIVVPTPSEPNGGFSLRHVVDAAVSMGRALAQKDTYHLVVLTSTVLPGSTDSVARILERESGKTMGKDFGLCYSPEFIALGSVIDDFLNPDFLLIGESDPEAGAHLEAFYRRVCDPAAPVARMNFVNAELAKIAVNSYVTTKISFANLLAEICERLPGGDVDAVTSALGLDSRIGASYLKGGLGFGGPCFPRDNQAFSYLASAVGALPEVPQATDRFNRNIVPRVVSTLRDRLAPPATVAVLGLAYKPNTNVVEEAQGLEIAGALAAAGYDVVAVDPAATSNARSMLGEAVRLTDDVRAGVRHAAAIVVANADRSFQVIAPDDCTVRPLLVVDCWRLLRNVFEAADGVDYVAVGTGAHVDEHRERLERVAEELGAVAVTTSDPR